MSRFWQRVTEGMQLTQLWSQFQNEARASYRLYSADVAAKTPEGLTRRGHHVHVVKEFFWAVLEKLSPARRVLLLAALILLVLPSGSYSYEGANHQVHAGEFDFHFWGGLLLFLLLMLEIADRVVMKRDLQIAREIQTWLLPGLLRRFPGSRSLTPHAPRTRLPETTTTYFPARGRLPKRIAWSSPSPMSPAKAFPRPCSWLHSRRASKHFLPRKWRCLNWLRT